MLITVALLTICVIYLLGRIEAHLERISKSLENGGRYDRHMAELRFSVRQLTGHEEPKHPDSELKIP